MKPEWYRKKWKWPDDNQPINDGDALLIPLKRALLRLCDVRDKDVPNGVAWEGPSKSKFIKATSADHDWTLSRKGLDHAAEKHGMDFLDVILNIALDLGMEEGRRLTVTDEYLNALNVLKNVKLPELSKFRVEESIKDWEKVNARIESGKVYFSPTFKWDTGCKIEEEDFSLKFFYGIDQRWIGEVMLETDIEMSYPWMITSYNHKVFDPHPHSHHTSEWECKEYIKKILSKENTDDRGNEGTQRR